MDIKDFILVGGGLLIVMVVAHGFWIAYRVKREPYRLDIVPDLIPDDVDDIERLRGELPNGGSRVVHATRRQREPDPAQTSLDLDPGTPTFADIKAEAERLSQSEDAAAVTTAEVTAKVTNVAAPDIATGPTEPTLAPRKPRVAQAGARTVNRPETPNEPTPITTAEPATSARVAEIQLVIPEAAPDRQQASTPAVDRSLTAGKREVPQREAAQREAAKREVPRRETPKRERESAREAHSDEPASDAVEELLVINVLAMRGQRFGGRELITALRRQGLRFGDMNIFHRVDHATKGKIFSVANIMEPGTFDMSDLDHLNSPGMAFFMQLPGPERALEAFEDMLNAAQKIAVELGGELRDEQLSVLTGQTREHMRQRIADFARRRLSKRA